LCAGETFYADGVRYDMPAIYVDDQGKFQYITFQTPLPKGDPVWVRENVDENVDDWSHVSSQWLASVPSEYNIWVLPPFNEPHVMIDDIVVWQENMQEENEWIRGPIIQERMLPLQFYYWREGWEPRFDTSLAERFWYIRGSQSWRWWSIYTKPYKYTEFILPNQETTRNTYRNLPFNCDGKEYLITTSWFTEPFTLESFTLETFQPNPIGRAIFEFDAEDGTGLYNQEIPREDSTSPPTADAGGPYHGCGERGILFDCSRSRDNDETDVIEDYRWDFNNDSIYDTGWISFEENPTYRYVYPGDYEGDAWVQVRDDEGETHEARAEVSYVSRCPGGTVLKMMEEILYIPYDSQEPIHARVWIRNVTNLATFQVLIAYDPRVVIVNYVNQGDIPLSGTYINNTKGEAGFNGYVTDGGLDGDFTLAYIGFEKSPDAQPGNTCYINFSISQLFDPNGNEIGHRVENGRVIITDGNDNRVPADFNGDGRLNINDVRYLALYHLGDPRYQDLHGCNPDVNCDNKANPVDIRYLAMHLLVPEEYPIYPSCPPFLEHF
jgi:hypothetical protein